MRELNDSDFLSIWESGSRRHPLDRALLCLGAALPRESFDAIASWPLGRRNRELLELHCAAFGPGLRGVVSCPNCGEKLEVSLDCRVLAGGDGGLPGDGARTVNYGGHAFRLPSTRDLASVARETDPGAAALRLVEACRVGDGARRDWSEGELDLIGEQMSGADPLAEIRIAVRCPECGHKGEEDLDIVTFLWAEIDARVRRLLSDIHQLASAYGWAESEILSLSESRRALYLEMLEP